MCAGAQIAYCNARDTAAMDWTLIQGNWSRFKVSAKQNWGKLTEAQLEAIAGRRELLARRIQDAYGMSQQEAEKQLTYWQSRQSYPARA
jgi:uncharacterized protein YjbJ (UPF0337 family)